MIDKTLVKNSFKKGLKTYNENAFIQSKMAEVLISFVPGQNYQNVLEIGMGTGILTSLAARFVKYKNYFANDLIADCKNYLEKIIPQAYFMEGDIESISIEDKFDLIISNASFQWVNDFRALVDKTDNLLNDDGLFIFSTFTDGNFLELKKATGKCLEYYPALGLEKILSDKFDIINSKEEEQVLYFNDFKTLLKHIKYTGVNAVSSEMLSLSELKASEKYYLKNFSSEKGIKLTYKPFYAVLKKK